MSLWQNEVWVLWEVRNQLAWTPSLWRHWPSAAMLSLKKKSRSKKSGPSRSSSSRLDAINDRNYRVVMLCEEIPTEKSSDSGRGSRHPSGCSSRRSELEESVTQRRACYEEREPHAVHGIIHKVYGHPLKWTLTQSFVLQGLFCAPCHHHDLFFRLLFDKDVHLKCYVFCQRVIRPQSLHKDAKMQNLLLCNNKLSAERSRPSPSGTSEGPRAASKICNLFTDLKSCSCKVQNLPVRKILKLINNGCLNSAVTQSCTIIKAAVFSQACPDWHGPGVPTEQPREPGAGLRRGGARAGSDQAAGPRGWEQPGADGTVTWLATVLILDPTS